MNSNQNETGELGSQNSESRMPESQSKRMQRTVGRRSLSKATSRISNSAFTLVELLVVITIISILAGLITVAVANALRAAKQAAIVLELQQIGGAVEDFKNVHGAYPPNGFLIGGNISSSDRDEINDKIRANFVRMFKKAFPKAVRSEAELFSVLVAENPAMLTSSTLIGGMSASEAVVFWLGSFSDDPRYPLSGPGGPSFNTNTYSVEPLEERNWRFEFDLGRLGPRNDDGTFNEDIDQGRFITYDFDNPSTGATEPRRINFWRYTPGESEVELMYFDVSRRESDVIGDVGSPIIPGDINSSPEDKIFALRKLREGVAELDNDLENVTYVNKGKFQILHCGVDDAWGDLSIFEISKDKGLAELTLYPTGPFIGDIADTLTHFTTGALSEEQE